MGLGCPIGSLLVPSRYNSHEFISTFSLREAQSFDPPVSSLAILKQQSQVPVILGSSISRKVTTHRFLKHLKHPISWQVPTSATQHVCSAPIALLRGAAPQSCSAVFGPCLLHQGLDLHQGVHEERLGKEKAPVFHTPQPTDGASWGTRSQSRAFWPQGSADGQTVFPFIGALKCPKGFRSIQKHFHTFALFRTHMRMLMAGVVLLPHSSCEGGSHFTDQAKFCPFGRKRSQTAVPSSL